jgi:hypothetical protein
MVIFDNSTIRRILLHDVKILKGFRRRQVVFAKFYWAEISMQPSFHHGCPKNLSRATTLWSVVAEWLGRRTLNQRVVGSNPGECTVRYL